MAPFDPDDPGQEGAEGAAPYPVRELWLQAGSVESDDSTFVLCPLSSPAPSQEGEMGLQVTSATELRKRHKPPDLRGNVFVPVSHA